MNKKINKQDNFVNPHCKKFAYHSHEVAKNQNAPTIKKVVHVMHCEDCEV